MYIFKFFLFQHNVQQTQQKLKDSTNEWRELFDDCSGRLFTTENTQLNFHWSGNGENGINRKTAQTSPHSNLGFFLLLFIH